MFLLLMLVAGAILGLVRGGRVSNFFYVRFRAWTLLILAFAIQLVIFSDLPLISSWSMQYGRYAYLASLVLVVSGIAVNYRLYSFPVILLGAVFNFVAIASNGGHMPSPAEAILAARGPEELEAIRNSIYFSNSCVMTPDTHFAILGDIFVLPPPFPLPNVFSAGDVLIGLGIMLFIQHALVGQTSERTTAIKELEVEN